MTPDDFRHLLTSTGHMGLILAYVGLGLAAIMLIVVAARSHR